MNKPLNVGNNLLPVFIQPTTKVCWFMGWKMGITEVDT